MSEDIQTLIASLPKPEKEVTEDFLDPVVVVYSHRQFLGYQDDYLVGNFVDDSKKACRVFELKRIDAKRVLHIMDHDLCYQGIGGIVAEITLKP